MNEVVIILDLGAMAVLCSFCRTIPVLVQSCNDVMEFEKFIGGKFKTSTLPYMLSKRFHDVKLLVAGVRPWANHYIFLVLMLCNLRQDLHRSLWDGV
jgi:hypothetical protein